MTRPTHHSPTCAGQDLSDRSGGRDVEQVDTGQGAVDYHCQDEDQYQDNLQTIQYNIRKANIY